MTSGFSTKSYQLVSVIMTLGIALCSDIDPVIRTTYTRLNDVHNSVRCSTIYPDKFSRNSPLWASNNRDDDMCQMDDDLDFGSSTKFDSPLLSNDFNKVNISFIPQKRSRIYQHCNFLTTNRLVLC